jgi:TIR domain
MKEGPGCRFSLPSRIIRHTLMTSIAVQWPAGGRLQCRSYDGIAVDRPAFIVIASAASAAAETYALELVEALDKKLRALAADEAVVSKNDHGSAEPAGCADIEGRHPQRLLVMVGDNKTELAIPATSVTWSQILPVLPRLDRTGASKLMKPPLNHQNVVYWSKAVAEVLPAVLACSGATLEVPSVFISYRQGESAALAVQLFDELSHRGFDVFLDHHRIPPGVNFQKRLTQELSDKSMVVVLESKTILESHWTTYEVTTAKACELSVYALALPDGTPVPDIPEHLRLKVSDADFVSKRFDKDATLDRPKLDEALTGIREAHDAGVIARRGAAREQLRRSLDLHGVTTHRVDPSTGAVTVTAQKKDYVIWSTPRSPELADFHGAHAIVKTPARGIVVALSRFLEDRTAQRIQWLSGVCDIQLFDRGQIEQLTQQIANGSLT